MADSAGLSSWWKRRGQELFNRSAIQHGQFFGPGSAATGPTWIGLGTLVVLLAGSPAGAQCEYDVAVIQGPSGSATIGTGLNNLGHVVGYYDYAGGDCNAFVWTQEAGLVTLAFPPGTSQSAAYGINDAGQVVGTYSTAAGYRGFLLDGQTLTNLGTFPGATMSEALSINDQGQIVGYWGNQITGDPALQGFLWQDGRMIDLAPDLGTENAVAHAINNAGQIVGWRGTADWLDARAFLWESGDVTDLGILLGGYTGEARAISARGVVVGRGFIADPACPAPAWHAFLQVKSSLIDLGTLPGHLRSRAMGINDAGQVVGSFDHQPTCSTPGAFLWQAGVMRDLNELILPNTGLTLRGAHAINETGQITGRAQTAGGSAVAFLLTPNNLPSGDIDHDCCVGILDLLYLLSSWGSAKSPADLDGDGIVGILDLLELLANWT